MAPIEQPLLSARSAVASKPPLSYLNIFLESMANLWSEKNSEGWISLTVAENKFLSNMIAERMNSVPALPSASLGYDNMKGTEKLREAVSAFANRTFLSGCARPATADDVCISAGCGAIIDNLVFLTCDPGDTALIIAPYYPAFDNDLKVKAGAIPKPVWVSDDIAQNDSIQVEPSVIKEQLARAADEATAAGSRVRNILITNPSNPLGRTFSEAQLRAIIEWCTERNVHLLCDEIYANSRFRANDDAPFVSAAAVVDSMRQSCAPDVAEKMDNLIHVLYGFSKDFGASGLRCGILISRSQPIHNALSNISYFCAVSNHTQHALACLLEDEAWTEAYLAANNAALAGAYGALTAALDKHGIPHADSSSAMFCWIDLRKGLREKTWAGEQELWGRLVEQRLLLTPGGECHAMEPGFFRVCFAWMGSEKALEVAVERIAKVVAST
ncbi:unnamed protein product [Pedinophyceae sp. YPF-701]|nr:unnamed protein product [Pedinophyceae sp. YPF-701]